MNESSKRVIRTRFAPSPSGFLHIGGVRTALFNWAYVRKHGGQFFLRIDDTDAKRHVEEAVEKIFGGLRWLGISWDGVYHQSLRQDKYAVALEKLNKAGLVYQSDSCYRLNVQRVTSSDDLDFDDVVLGSIKKSVSEIEDFVIIRSDGSSVYSFATVVDDVDLKITHVIRGQEHISNTFPQLLLYQALGEEPPEFAHIPFICAPRSKRKLSKRDAIQLDVPVYLDQYKDQGYLPDAVFNYLTHLGWAMDATTEKWSQNEFVQAFDLRDVMKSPAMLDIEKLNWLQGEYFKELSLVDKWEAVSDYLYPQSIISQVIKATGDRLTKPSDIDPYVHFWDDSKFFFDPKAVQKRLDKNARKILTEFTNDYLEDADPWTAEVLHEEVYAWTIMRDIKPAVLIHALRVATTGQMVGFGLFEGMEILGRKRCLGRIACIPQDKYAKLGAISE